LYSKANTVITIYTIIGALIGGILGYIVGRVGGLLFGLVVFGSIGFYLGREKAFWLKLQAQTSLCQAKIEENTRKQT
jgi:F0F1-type ATP synthase assembly protein I